MEDEEKIQEALETNELTGLNVETQLALLLQRIKALEDWRNNL